MSQQTLKDGPRDQHVQLLVLEGQVQESANAKHTSPLLPFVVHQLHTYIAMLS
jgi:hypothetical protein